ncbi:hypothetical protein F5B22DRAFT_603557 [Xylaria bambusicola]|uniref:uncharacterized protein n=1 Tax=Xylaria bambusicola TaxID=326684 RepID=UPI002008C64E|nr:uncharacterized protein F5B22DRAFT_603557 [Xylaria bambusicola]KAI0517622.1 hypothetical protein F5B22DRAFT_603557 [Xylaria bambusicola]
MRVINFALAVSLVRATPLHSIVRRDPCDGVNGSPILYHEYREDACPAPYKFDSNIPGQCEKANDWRSGCSTFCQVRTTFVYGQESPFVGTYCHGPFTCSITSTLTTNITYMGSLNPSFDLAGALKVGVSAGYSQNQVSAIARAFSVTLDPGQCGYFTYVPVKKTFCGSYSHGQLLQLGHALNYCVNVVTEGNVCDEVTWTINGQADGETIFVKTDCTTREPLPLDQQDPIYQQPGVPLDRGLVASILNTWVQDTCKVDYQFFDDYFEVTGTNWSADLLGPNGENIKNAIRHCGALTSWKFEVTSDTMWFASGKLPIGVKSCVGTQIQNAGGSSAGSCKGAG